MKKTLQSFVLCGLCLLSVNKALADSTIHSVNIIQDTLQALPSCIHYKITGMCYWLSCSGVACKITTSLKLDHYLPDAVVSVYTQPNNDPWLFTKIVDDPIFYQAGKTVFQQLTHFKMSYGDEHNNSRRDLNNKFHEVDVVGNPALLFLKVHELLLPSVATMYFPYYSSLLDAYAWRFPALERFYPGSVVPGLHDVGKIILHDWGSVYPRNGYVNQPDDAKAAAVIALRASTIITQSAQPHLYSPLSNSCGDHCSVDPVKENSVNAQFQMIYPTAEKQCIVFGASDINQTTPWQTEAAIQGNNRYVWILWRHYHGCAPVQNAKYLGSINF